MALAINKNFCGVYTRFRDEFVKDFQIGSGEAQETTASVTAWDHLASHLVVATEHLSGALEVTVDDKITYGAGTHLSAIDVEIRDHVNFKVQFFTHLGE